MESIIVGFGSFLVTGAVIVIVCHIGLTVSKLRARRASKPGIAVQTQEIQERILSAFVFQPSAQFETRRHVVRTFNGRPFRL
jgi:hypothetical protein